MILSLPPVTVVGTTPGNVDWSQQFGTLGADFVRLANWTPNALTVRLANRAYTLDPWTADVLPAYCKNRLRFEPVTVSAAAALPGGATAVLLVTVAYGEPIPGIYPLPLSVASFTIDSAAGDIRQLVDQAGPAIAGAIGLAADANHGHPAKAAGQMEVTGATAGYLFIDRTSARAWQLYGTGDKIRLFNAALDVLTVDPNGNLVVVGSAAGLVLTDRSTARLWQWYATGDFMRLWNGAIDVLTLSTGGLLAAAGGVGNPTVDHTHGIDHQHAGTGFMLANGVAGVISTGQSANHTHTG